MLLSCSTFASWEDVRQWKGKLRDDCWECTAEIRTVVAEVTKGLKSPEEKVRALLNASAGRQRPCSPQREPVS